jgi:hypothetical protein
MLMAKSKCILICRCGNSVNLAHVMNRDERVESQLSEDRHCYT